MRFRVTITAEYDIDPEWYPQTSDIDEMAAIDEANYNSGSIMVAEILDGLAYRVAVEPVKDPDQGSNL